MRRAFLSSSEKGYTLIELLLYIVMLGMLLTSVTYFFGTIIEARVKNQTIAEVDEQGTAAMDYITQTIRNASSINSPAAGASASSLSLVVPTAGLSPTIVDTTSTTLGYNQDGGTTDTSNSNFINATKFTATSTGTISTLYALIGATIGSSPNNQAQMAIYSGATPTTLLASSASKTLTANSWNAFSISPVSVTSGTTYWLAYNTNGTTTTQNGMRYHTGTSGQARFIAQTFGTWPSSWSGSTQNFEFSVYAPIVTSGASALQVKEGGASTIPLTSNEVQLSDITFTNLTRSGTSGIVRVSFTISYVNTTGRNQYDYQKTFIDSAEVGW